MLVLAHVRDPNRRTVCVREVQKSLSKSVKQLIEDKIRGLGVESHFHVTTTEIRSRKGSGLILFQGMSDQTAESIKSLEGFDCAWVEEAQALSKRSLELLRPTIRKDGSEIWFTWNPMLDTDPVDAFLRGDGRPDDCIVVEVNYTDNPWFPETLRIEAEYDLRTDPEKHDHVWRGGYLRFSAARVFTNWRVEEFEAPKDAILRFGVDWGFSPDPTVLLRGFIEGRKLYIEYEAYQVECEIEDTAALFLTVPDSEMWPISFASDRPERVKSILRAGFKGTAVLREKGSVQEGVDFLKNLQIIVHPRCVHTATELRLFSRKIDPLTGAVLPILEDKYNHCIDAMRHMVDPVRRLSRPKADSVTSAASAKVQQHWGGVRRG